MPLPFPGTNPYLEQDDVWYDFHDKLMPSIAEVLVAQVRPNYIVKSDEHIYVHKRALEPSRRFQGRADLGVAGSETVAGLPLSAGVIEARVRVHVPALDVERVAFVEDPRPQEPQAGDGDRGAEPGEQAAGAGSRPVRGEASATAGQSGPTA